MGDQNRALSHYTKAIELVPDWAYPYANLSRWNNIQGMYDEGIKNAKKSLELSPDFPIALIGLGEAARNKKDYLLALESYLRALQKNDKFRIVYRHLAGIHVDLGNLGKANHYYDKLEETYDSTDFDDGPITFHENVTTETAAGQTLTIAADFFIDPDSLSQDNVVHLDYIGRILDDDSYLRKAIEMDTTNTLSIYKLGQFYFNRDQLALGMHYMHCLLYTSPSPRDS